MLLNKKQLQVVVRDTLFGDQEIEAIKQRQRAAKLSDIFSRESLGSYAAGGFLFLGFPVWAAQSLIKSELTSYIDTIPYSANMILHGGALVGIAVGVVGASANKWLKNRIVDSSSAPRVVRLLAGLDQSIDSLGIDDIPLDQLRSAAKQAEQPVPTANRIIAIEDELERLRQQESKLPPAEQKLLPTVRLELRKEQQDLLEQLKTDVIDYRADLAAQHLREWKEKRGFAAVKPLVDSSASASLLSTKATSPNDKQAAELKKEQVMQLLSKHCGNNLALKP